MLALGEMSSWRLPYQGYPKTMVHLSESETHENVVHSDMQENDASATEQPCCQQGDSGRQNIISFSSNSNLTSLAHNSDPASCGGSQLSHQRAPLEAQFQAGLSSRPSSTIMCPYGLDGLGNAAAHEHRCGSRENRSYNDILLDEIAVEDLICFQVPCHCPPKESAPDMTNRPPESFPPGNVHLHGTRASREGVSLPSAPYDDVFPASAPQSGVPSRSSRDSDIRSRSVTRVSTAIDDTVFGSIAMDGVIAGSTLDDGILPGSVLNDDIFSRTMDSKSTIQEGLCDKYTNNSEDVPYKNDLSGALPFKKLLYDGVSFLANPVGVETYVVSQVTKPSSVETQSDLTDSGEQTTERQETGLSPREFKHSDLLVPNFGALASVVTKVHFENQTNNNPGADQRLEHPNRNTPQRQIRMLDIIDCVIQNTIAEHSERQSVEDKDSKSPYSQDPDHQV